jgi:deoxyribonuclease-4|tara:strand:- start:217 stop:1065 length:849 start_codon:yes stop_codon:yes gene_type:complete
MKLGAHESIAGGVGEAILRGQKATCDVIQIFNKSNHQWKAKKIVKDDLDLYFQNMEETGIKVVCSHASYLINLASPDRSLSDRSCTALKVEMERCELLHIPRLIIHPGSHLGKGIRKGIERIAKNIDKLFERIPDNNVTLTLETTAGQGNNIGSSFEEIAEIIDLSDSGDRLGACLDTCHVFAAGYPLENQADYRKTMERFSTIIGFSKLKVVHLNDSKGDLGSRIDRHEHIGKGKIGKDAFANILNDKRFHNIPMVLETPKKADLKNDVENLNVLRSMIGK